jgi:hypothetical protein
MDLGTFNLKPSVSSFVIPRNQTQSGASKIFVMDDDDFSLITGPDQSDYAPLVLSNTKLLSLHWLCGPSRTTSFDVMRKAVDRARAAACTC